MRAFLVAGLLLFTAVDARADLIVEDENGKPIPHSRPAPPPKSSCKRVELVTPIAILAAIAFARRERRASKTQERAAHVAAAQ